MTSFVGRLVSHYTYTPGGRLETASIDLSDDSDPSDAFTETYAFDPGRRWRTAEGPTANPGFISYAYTGTGRLARYTRQATTEQPALSAEYLYDAAGQRKISRVTVGEGEGEEVTTTDFTYTGLTLQKLSATRTGGTGPGTWKLAYLYDEYGRPCAGIYRDDVNPAPVVFAMVTTDRGDVVEILDASGEPFAAYRYDAWGNPQGAGNVGTGVWTQTTGLVTGDLEAKIAAR